MRVGKDNLWGYSFKLDSGVSYEQIMVVGVTLAILCEHDQYFTDSTEMIEGTEIELNEPKEIWGIGIDMNAHNTDTTIGIIWGMKDRHLLEAILRAEIDKAFTYWPYKITEGRQYVIRDGEAYERDNNIKTQVE